MVQYNPGLHLPKIPVTSGIKGITIPPPGAIGNTDPILAENVEQRIVAPGYAVWVDKITGAVIGEPFRLPTEPGGAGGAGDPLGWARLEQDKSQFEQTLELNKQQLLESKSQTLIQGFNAMLNAGKLTDDQAKNQFEAQMTEYEALIDNINTTYKNNFESWNAQNIDNYNRQVAEQTRQQGLMSEATTRGRDVARDILPYLVGTTPFNAEKYYNKMGIPVPSPQAISQTPYAPAPAVPELPAVPTGGYQPTPVPPFDIEDLRRKMGLI